MSGIVFLAFTTVQGINAGSPSNSLVSSSLCHLGVHKKGRNSSRREACEHLQCWKHLVGAFGDWLGSTVSNVRLRLVDRQRSCMILLKQTSMQEVTALVL